MEIKIAHCADVHLGTNSSKLASLGNMRKTETKSSFFSMLDIINKNKVDLLLICGDLFHDLKMYNSEVDEVKDALRKLSCKTVITPGNHDPFVLDSPYCGVWPENVYIFEENKITFFEIKDLKTRVWGSAFTDFGNSSGAKIVLDDENDDFINILMAHGTLFEKENSKYNPIELEDIRKSRMNYVALGHIHKRTHVVQSGRTFYAYCGCLEGKSFKEIGEKGFYLGTLSKSSCKLEFINVAKRKYVELDIDLSNLNHSLDILDSVYSEIRQLKDDNYTENLYRIILNGEVKNDFFIDTDYIKSKLEDNLFFVEICNRTEIILDESGSTLKGIFIKNMNDYIKTCRDEKMLKVAQMALKLGLMSFSREVKFDEN